MANGRGSFGHERYAGLKLAVTIGAVAGFVAAWAGLGASHASPPPEPVALPSASPTPQPTQSPAPGRTPTPYIPPTAAATSETEERPPATRTRVRSRGS